MFDPYHKWLAISPGQRPPTYYQLLGIASEEKDPEVIQEAAIRQTMYVRTYQASQFAEVCTRLLNEIAQARNTLLNPAKRADYDASLRAAGETIGNSHTPGEKTSELQAEGIPEVFTSPDRPAFPPQDEPLRFEEAPEGRNGVTATLPRRTTGSSVGLVLLALLYTFLLFGEAALSFWLASTKGEQVPAGAATPGPGERPGSVPRDRPGRP